MDLVGDDLWKSQELLRIRQYVPNEHHMRPSTGSIAGCLKSPQIRGIDQRP